MLCYGVEARLMELFFRGKERLMELRTWDSTGNFSNLCGTSSFLYVFISRTSFACAPHVYMHMRSIVVKESVACDIR